MPHKWIDGIQLSTGQRLTGWAWFHSGKYREEKHQLAALIDKLRAEQDQMMEDLGYCTASRTLPEIQDWLDDTIDHYRYNGQTWWQRNWFPMIMLIMMGGGMVLIGLVNGWS